MFLIPRAPVLAALALSACAAPELPAQYDYPFGLDAAIHAASAPSGDRARDLAQREVVASAIAMNCPDWDRARLRHPIDAIVGNPYPSDAPAMGCHVQTALDAMVARPSDIAEPPADMAPAPAAAQDRALLLHRTTGPRSLPPREGDGFIGGGG